MSNGAAGDAIGRAMGAPPSASRLMTAPKQEPFLSRSDKILLGLSLVGIATAGLLVYTLTEKKPKKVKRSYGIMVNDQCNSFEVTDEGIVRSEIQREIDNAAKLGAVDPFNVAEAFLAKAAPHCRKYPDQTRNPGEAGLFAMTFNTVVDMMQSQQLLSQQQVNTFKAMMQTWAMAQGVPASEF